MSYDEFVASIQETLANLTTFNIVFAVLLFIRIVAIIIVFAIYTRKEYYRKKSEIDDFMFEERQKTDIFVPGISDKKKEEKLTLTEKIYKYLNKDD